AAERVAGKATDRLRLGEDHTVVALAGATGSGKSSLFNALAGAATGAPVWRHTFRGGVSG
ncbi:MAG: hypothetical protein QOI35_1555, partial [Cryptosporangiaceae bacterium]|nr:hypothetical protein [Cryptosporangiaceae bacterium]